MSDILVKLADMAVINGCGDGLAVYGLGSTVAVILYDETTKVGGCLQFMLSGSMSNPQRAREYPGMFADTGIALLVKSCLAAGARRESLTARLAGGADLMEKGPGYRIGEENVTAARKILSGLGITVQAEATGGCVFRTVRLDTTTGRTYLKRHGGGWEELR
jgi:chemotaxis protein CheD